MTDALQIFADDERWLAEVDDLTEARAACVQLADDGEALPLRVEHRDRLSATFDDDGFRILQVIA
jgi:hypothetical protein